MEGSDPQKMKKLQTWLLLRSIKRVFRSVTKSSSIAFLLCSRVPKILSHGPH